MGNIIATFSCRAGSTRLLRQVCVGIPIEEGGWNPPYSENVDDWAQDAINDASGGCGGSRRA